MGNLHIQQMTESVPETLLNPPPPEDPEHVTSPQVMECGVCMTEKKFDPDLDVECAVCKYRVCYECMFEYIKFNVKKRALLCPHCRQDLTETSELSLDGNANFLGMFLACQELYADDADEETEFSGWREFTSDSSDSSEYTSDSSFDNDFPYDYSDDSTDETSDSDTDETDSERDVSANVEPNQDDPNESQT